MVVIKKRALITGFTGQDGSYLAEFLLEKGYHVIAIIRRNSTPNLPRVEHIKHHVEMYEADLGDTSSLIRVLAKTKPDEIYHLGAMSWVHGSFHVPTATGDITGLGTSRLLEAIRILHMEKEVKFYNASSSEMFGLAKETPQNENTPFYPRSPYGIAKVYAFQTTRMFREAYGLFACNGILFNHDGPRRGKEFVTRKITHAAAEIALGTKEYLELGNLNAKRDFGYAPEFIEAMWLILQQETPEDYVIATGESHTVREFAEKAFSLLNMPIQWEGEGDEEVGINKETGKILIKVNKELQRPAEVYALCGDSSKARKKLGWHPKTRFDEIVKIMVEADYERLKKTDGKIIHHY